MLDHGSAAQLDVDPVTTCEQNCYRKSGVPRITGNAKIARFLMFVFDSFKIRRPEMCVLAWPQVPCPVATAQARMRPASFGYGPLKLRPAFENF